MRAATSGPFGAVLYEMVTGQKAFQGKSYSSLVGAILSTDPAPMAVQPFTPAWLERLVRRCLQKDADDRWQSMRDVVIELKSPPAAERALSPVAAKAGWWPWAVAGACALASLVAGVLLYNATRPAPLRSLMHLNVEIPPGTPLARVDVAAGVGGNTATGPTSRSMAIGGTSGREEARALSRPTTD